MSPRRWYAYNETSVDPSVWTTVVSLNPFEDIVVIGCNADMAAILSANYRLRLLVDGSVVMQELLGTTSPSWVPIEVTVPAGKVVSVQLRHAEATAQDCAATINYRWHL